MKRLAFVLDLMLLISACTEVPPPTQTTCPQDGLLCVAVYDDTFAQWDGIFLSADSPRDALSAFAAVSPAFRELYDDDNCSVILRQEAYPMAKELLASNDFETSVSLIRLVCAVCPEMNATVEYDFSEILPHLTDRELVSLTADSDLLTTPKDSRHDWIWLLYHSDSAEEALASFAAECPAFGALFARESCPDSLMTYGIPIVAQFMESEAYTDHVHAIALGRLIRACAPDAGDTLAGIPSIYRDMSDEELIRAMGSHPKISFFLTGPYIAPLSDRGVEYFSAQCPELAELLHRDSLTDALAQYGRPLAMELHASDRPQTALDGLAFMELVVFYNPELAPELEAMYAA